MATITLGNVGQAEAVHVGLNAKVCRISLSATISSGDIHIIGRLPHGAIPIDAIFYQGTAFPTVSTGVLIKFGTSASNSLFFASTTFSAGTPVTRSIRQLGSGKQVSLSDDAMPRYENIVMVAAAGSVGHMGDLVVYYKMPGQSF